ncbi:hypothetical protein ACWDUX_30430 [Streptomyces sp. NPDC003444]
MSRYAVDAAELVAQAANAARLSTPKERLAALTAAFQDCGERAHVYHCPEAVVLVLIKEIVDTFHAERKEFHRA